MLWRCRKPILATGWLRPRWLSGGLAGLLLTRVSASQACPVCFSAGNQHALEAYYLTAVLMTLLPLVILGSIAGWLYFRFRDSGTEAAGRTSEPLVIVSPARPRAPAE